MPYYAYWERAIFAALNTMVLAGLQKLLHLMGGGKHGHGAEDSPSTKPLFKVR